MQHLEAEPVAEPCIFQPNVTFILMVGRFAFHLRSWPCNTRSSSSSRKRCGGAVVPASTRASRRWASQATLSSKSRAIRNRASSSKILPKSMNWSSGTFSAPNGVAAGLHFSETKRSGNLDAAQPQLRLVAVVERLQTAGPRARPAARLDPGKALNVPRLT